MGSISDLQTSEQDDMRGFPPGQDVIQTEDLLGWSAGPLPDQAIEAIALKLFSRLYPTLKWTDPLFNRERNECRRFALQLRVAFLKIDRWTIENAHEKCATELSDVIFGDRRLGQSIRGEVLDYCETFIADAWGHFGRRLFYPREVEANDRELKAEDGNG